MYDLLTFVKQFHPCDFVIIKMDVEGVEFDILPHLSGKKHL